MAANRGSENLKKIQKHVQFLRTAISYIILPPRKYQLVTALTKRDYFCE